MREHATGEFLSAKPYAHFTWTKGLNDSGRPQVDPALEPSEKGTLVSPSLYGAFAFGSRGLVWSVLGAELIAAQIEGEPWPIERELAEAIDPGRFLLRALRHGELG